MELYFLRHAIALEPKDFKGSDPERPLTEEGIEKIKQAAKGLATFAVDFDAVVSSPYTRARHTAEIVAKVIGLKSKIQYSDAMTPFAHFKDFLKLIEEFSANDKILLVGHQPTIGQFVSHLVFGRETANIDISKGGLCRVDIPNAETGILGELKWLLTCQQLRNLA